MPLHQYLSTYHQMRPEELAAFKEFLEINNLKGNVLFKKPCLLIERNDPRFQWIDPLGPNAPITHENRSRTVFVGAMHFNVSGDEFRLSPNQDDTAVDFMREINRAMQRVNPDVVLKLPQGHETLPTSDITQEGMKKVQAFAAEHHIPLIITAEGRRFVMLFDVDDARLPITRARENGPPMLELEGARWLSAPGSRWHIRPMQGQTAEDFISHMQETLGQNLGASPKR